MTGIFGKKQDDEALREVSGGRTIASADTKEATGKKTVAAAGKTVGSGQTRKALCPKCGIETTFDLYSGGRAVCRECEYETFM